MILLYQVITLNVAVNSFSNSVLSLLVSNQFMEVKSSVFKKFERENLYQLSCSDAIERFQLFAYIFIIAIRNLSQINLSGSDLWNRIVQPLLLICLTEIVIDGLKHAFITKFNQLSPSSYRFFKDSIASDFYLSLHSSEPSTVISRKMGFSVLPLTCLVILILFGAFKGASCWFIGLLFCFLVVLKIICGLILNFLSQTRKGDEKSE